MMQRLRRVPSLLIFSTTTALAVLLLAPRAGAQSPPKPELLRLDAEYRVATQLVDPFELSGIQVTDAAWTEQRLRLDLTLTRDPVTLHLQADLLDGVLFGDNGTYGQDPSPNSGVALATKRPNSTSWIVGLRPGADPLDPDSYIPVLRGVDPVVINHAYADVALPFGLLRVGRQPLVYGANLTGHEGTRINRWGVSRFSDSVDRVLFATKLDAIYESITKGGHAKLDTSLERGVFLAGFYDWLAQGVIGDGSDETRQIGVALQFRRPRLGPLRDIFLSANAVHIGDPRFATDAWGFPMRADFRVGPVGATFMLMLISGESREISEGFATLNGTVAQIQGIHALGGQALVDVDVGPLTFTAEFDYASGDDDPRPSTDITSFSFARDLNVGLFLFEHILAFESARSAAVGIENLSKQNASSFPLTEVATDGRFTNAMALFPQVLARIVHSKDHRLHVRLGALFAWPAAAGGVVDPIMTSLAEDGEEISDDAVNFHGGDPGSYYGTELDGQIQYSFRDRFFWTIESAVLFPGSSLQNEHGDAVRAFFLESRFTYVF
jgi:hypothetical protein